MYFRFFIIISPWKRAGPFIWTNLNPLHPKMHCAKFVKLFSPWTFTPFTPWCHVLTTLPFPWWRLLTPCLFCNDLGLFILCIHNYHSTGGHLHANSTWLHHPKVRYHVIYLCNKQNKTLGQPAKNHNGGPMYSLCSWLQNLSFRLYFYKQWYRAFSISTKQSI